jgi:2'-5' RNA ligase
VGGDLETIANIALDHLKEDQYYYTKLRVIMQKFDKPTLEKYCGVDPEDDMLFGTAVSDFVATDMPNQGANESQIVSIGGGEGSNARPAVWKPMSGEKPDLINWIGGSLYRRAEAAYLLDRELAPDEKHYLVPVAFMTEVDGEPGSVQQYVTGRQPRESVKDYAPEWVEQAAVLDYIMGQVDRDDRNWLTHPHDDKRPVLIDNDLSFSPDKDAKLHSSFVDAMEGVQLKQKTLDMIYLAIGNRDLWEDLNDCLNDEQAVKNAKVRAELLYRNQMIGGSGKPLTILVKSKKTLKKAAKEENTGAMVAIDVPDEISEKLINSNIDWPEGSEILPSDEIHITLAFFGEAKELDYGKQNIEDVVEAFVKKHQPITGRINGIGRFLESHKSGMNCIYANFDSPDLPDLRQELVEALNMGECHVEDNHGFTPHITLAYIPEDAKTPDTSKVEVLEFEVKGISVFWNEDEPMMYPFSGEELNKSDFQEDQHPRKDDGKFAPKGSGGAGQADKETNNNPKKEDDGESVNAEGQHTFYESKFSKTVTDTQRKGIVNSIKKSSIPPEHLKGIEFVTNPKEFEGEELKIDSDGYTLFDKNHIHFYGICDLESGKILIAPKIAEESNNFNAGILAHEIGHHVHSKLKRVAFSEKEIEKKFDIAKKSKINYGLNGYSFLNIHEFMADTYKVAKTYKNEEARKNLADLFEVKDINDIWR